MTKNMQETNLAEKVTTSLSSIRSIYSLNGTWECTKVKEENKDIIPTSWGHTVQVPGLVDAAFPALEDYDYVFYHKEFTIEEDVTGTVFLKIFKGCYGKKIWLNGNLVGWVNIILIIHLLILI